MHSQEEHKFFFKAIIVKDASHKFSCQLFSRRMLSPEKKKFYACTSRREPSKSETWTVLKFPPVVRSEHFPFSIRADAFIASVDQALRCVGLPPCEGAGGVQDKEKGGREQWLRKWGVRSRRGTTCAR